MYTADYVSQEEEKKAHSIVDVLILRLYYDYQVRGLFTDSACIFRTVPLIAYIYPTFPENNVAYYVIRHTR